MDPSLPPVIKTPRRSFTRRLAANQMRFSAECRLFHLQSELNHRQREAVTLRRHAARLIDAEARIRCE